MSLTVATLIPGLLLLALGVPLLAGHSGFTVMLKAFPRSQTATYVFFTAGAARSLHALWLLSPANFGAYRTLLFCAFAVIAVLSLSACRTFWRCAACASLC